MGSANCRACDSEGESVDTVKLSGPEGTMDKENATPNVCPQEEEELKKQQEAEEEKKRLAEMAKIEEESRRQLELAKRQKEEELRLQQEEEKRRAEEQRQREEQHRVEAEARRVEEAKRREIEEKRMREKKKQDDTTLKNFLENTCGGLADVNDKKKTSFGKFSYPLHIAVKKCDADVVRVLLENKADKTLKTASGQTALEKANKYNKNGSYGEIIRLLSRQ